MIRYKMDIMKELKNAGYSTYKIRKEKMLGEATLQKLRENKMVSFENLNTICKMLDCQPGDILEFIPEINNNSEVGSTS